MLMKYFFKNGGSLSKRFCVYVLYKQVLAFVNRAQTLCVNRYENIRKINAPPLDLWIVMPSFFRLNNLEKSLLFSN